MEDLIRRAKLNWQERHAEDPEPMEMMLPLIRLKVRIYLHSPSPDLVFLTSSQVETSEAKEMTNPVRFGQDFVGRVANPRDILQYYRRKKTAEKSKHPSADRIALADTAVAESKNLPDAPDEEEEDWGGDTNNPAAMTASDRLAKLRMSNLVRQYLQAQNLEVLVENGLEDAVMRFVDKDDRDAIKE